MDLPELDFHHILEKFNNYFFRNMFAPHILSPLQVRLRYLLDHQYYLRASLGLLLTFPTFYFCLFSQLDHLHHCIQVPAALPKTSHMQMREREQAEPGQECV